MEKYFDLAGEWQAASAEFGRRTAVLPGTLDENGIGGADVPGLAGRLTRKHTFTGTVRFSRKIVLPEAGGGRLFLEAERARKLRLVIENAEIPAFQEGSLSTPWVFEITPFAGKTEEICLISDNTYEGCDREGILRSSAATDETQTNWNGILGYLRIRREEENFVQNLRIYPEKNGKTLRIAADLCLGRPARQVLVESTAFAAGREMLSVTEFGPFVTAEKSGILLADHIRLWDEDEGNLYLAEASIDGGSPYTGRFGIRWFGTNKDARLTINGRVFFLRGEANCCVFSETGHPPMEKEAWKEILEIYRSYGVNCMRFHSWCPPEAAFAAADELGVMMQPELSHWNCENAFEQEGSFAFYRHELKAILRQYASHPSFVMLTFGNELHAGPSGHASMDRLLREARQMDDSRLYANASNCHYGERGADPESDFYTSMAYYQDILRAASPGMEGHLNREYPDAQHNYQEAAEKITSQGKPVFGFEVGQYESLPDFGQIEDFTGVTLPLNLERIRENAEKSGMLSSWKQYCEASGELALLCYREEVEAVLRTPAMSGLSLLGLQDFTGQGTALVGMLDAHLKPKPFAFAEPARFRAFFTPVLPLLFLPRYTYSEGEVLKAQVKLANHGKYPVKAALTWSLFRTGERIMHGEGENRVYPEGGLRDAGTVEFSLPRGDKGERFDLEIRVGEYANRYPVWVYPENNGGQETEKGMEIVENLNEEMIAQIEKGKRIFLEPVPDKAHLPHSIGGQFSTDFWSVENFPQQEGGMGLVIDEGHPALAGFPTESHSNWQWWVPAHGRPVVLPQRIHPIITVPDCHSRLKHMGLLAEFRLGKGAVLFSSMGLHFQLQYPETRALLGSLLAYAAGEFAPDQEITRKELEEITGGVW